jgi:hypothetical protein
MAASANRPERAIFPWFFISRKYLCFRPVVELDGEGEKMAGSAKAKFDVREGEDVVSGRGEML